MSAPRYFLGVDGGGTKTEFVCIDALRGLRITRRAFARPPDFELAAAWPAAPGRFGEGVRHVG